MTDHFATLGVPRRPWLEEADLKARFHALTAAHHPDVALGSPSPEGAESSFFSSLTVAYRVLADPRARLRHWLELEAPGEAGLLSGGAAPPSVADLFLETGAKKQRIDAFLKEQAAAGSAVAKALLMPRHLALQEELEAFLAILEAERARWLERLPALDAAWRQSASARNQEVRDVQDVLLLLAETARALGFLDRWSAQIREALTRLQIGI